MGRRKREAMSEGKKNIIGMMLEEYEIKSAVAGHAKYKKIYFW